MIKTEMYEGIFHKLPVETPTIGEPDGPLFGNGDIGVAVGGSCNNLTFWIGKNDIWLADELHKCECEGGLKCFGTVEVQSDLLKDASFTAVQKITTADVEIDLCNKENHLHIRSYAPYQQSLIVLELEARKGEIPIKMILSPMEESAAECRQSVTGNNMCAEKNYTQNVEWETKSICFGRIFGWNETEGVLKAGEKITAVMSLYTNHDMEKYEEQARLDVEKMTPELLAQYREEHLDWWREFWQTSGITIPSEPEVEKFWYGSHYLLACCCKKDKFAPGIFGNWNTTNNPNWSGDYHLNYNYQAPWWGCYSSNKVMLADPYDQPLLDYIPKARENAQTKLGCRGILSKVGIGPKGLETCRIFRADGTEDTEIPYWGQKSNSAYAVINMMMRFYSTWDREYAEKCVMPYLREVVDFWEDYLKFEDGRYVDYNDCIHENSALGKGIYNWVPDDLPDYSDDINPILTLGLLRVVFKGILDISEYLNVDVDRREKWEHILEHLSEYPLQEREGKTVFRYTEKGMDWCDGNSLGIQHIFPCGTIGLSSDEKILEIARNTVEAMHRWSDYNAFPTFFTAAARVGYNPEIILSKFKEQFLNHSFPNLFIYYGGGGIECCSAVPSCINEMLFQSYENILRFFPVWEKEKDASFEKLRAYGAFVVSAELKNKVVQNVELFSEKGRPCAVLCPWENGMRVYKDEVPVDCKTEEIRDGVVYRFETEAGSKYTLKKIDE